MTDGRTGFHPSEALVEIRFEENLRLLDVLGHLAHDLDPFFAEVSVVAQSHVELMTHGAPVGRVTSSTCLLFQGHEESQDAYVERLTRTWEIVAKYLKIEAIERVGIRSAYFVGYETVEGAVSTFRDVFFNYYDGPLSEIGKPVEVVAQARFDGWKAWEGVPLSVLLRVTPIHVLEALREAFKEHRYDGALLIDMDRYAVESLPAHDVGGIVDFALRAGYETAGELGAQLRAHHEKGDQPGGVARVDSA